MTHYAKVPRIYCGNVLNSKSKRQRSHQERTGRVHSNLRPSGGTGRRCRLRTCQVQALGINQGMHKDVLSMNSIVRALTDGCTRPGVYERLYSDLEPLAVVSD